MISIILCMKNLEFSILSLLDIVLIHFGTSYKILVEQLGPF